MKVRGRVLSVASECVPLVKTGGLADVVGALPGALAPLGWEMRVLLPAYRALRARVAGWPEVWREEGLWGGPGVVRQGTVDGITVLGTISTWMSKNGIDGKKFEDTAKSFAVSGKVQRALQMSAAYQLTGVPALVVDGKYIALGNSFDGMLANLDALIVRARAERAGAGKKGSRTVRR